MKRYVLPIIVWLCLIAALPFSRSLAEEPLHLQSVQADFVQEKHLKILVRPLVSTGTFTFQAPQSLRWEYRTPVPSILLMHGGRVKKFVERDGRLMEDQGMPFDSMQVVLGQLSNWLDGRFADNDLFRVSFADDHTVLLVPRQQALAGLIDRIELQLADRKGLLNGVTIYEGPDSYTRMTFDNTVLNRQIPAAVFTDK
jgi:outer membrane lipoprotein-sorting protein